MSGLAGAMNPNSYGGTAFRLGSRATVPAGGLGTDASSLARIRKNASFAPLGITLTVQLPPAGDVTKASSLNWFEFSCDAATAPVGSINWNSKLSSRDGVSIATRSRAPPLASLSGYSKHSPATPHSAESGTLASRTVAPSQNTLSPTASDPPPGWSARAAAGASRAATAAAASVILRMRESKARPRHAR